MGPKPAFQRLPAEKQENLLETAMKLYSALPYNEVTVRLLCGEMQLNPAVFYRYFDSKDDLLLYLAKLLNRRDIDYLTQQLRQSSVSDSSYFPEFSPGKPDYYSELEYRFLLALNHYPIGVVHDIVFHVSQDTQAYYRSVLELEREAGNLRPDVDVGLIAYMYATTGYNLLRYSLDHGLTHQEYLKRKVYFYYSFFYHGILLPGGRAEAPKTDTP